jgi:hypothetical protein
LNKSGRKPVVWEFEADSTREKGRKEKPEKEPE